MIGKKTFLIDDAVHERLKALAKQNGLTTGGMVRRLVDAFEGQPNYATHEYKKWLEAVCKIGRLAGSEAAERYISENPAPR